jgi:calnexin
MIDDESAEKPEDWDEDAPATILDEKSVKPEKWFFYISNF